MTFKPIVPIGGLAGFRFIERTKETQQATFNNSPSIARDIEYFKENIKNAATADDLTNDYRLLKVALGAFGLETEIGKKYFVNRILSEGTDEPTALANKLVDTRYQKLAREFGYGNQEGPAIEQSDFAEKIISKYKTQKFEAAVGESDNNIRLALNFQREIMAFSDPEARTDTQWYQIMGNSPMRTVVETALGLPTSVGALSVERQLEIFKEKTSALYGSEKVSAFTETDNLENLVKDYLLRAQSAPNLNSGAKGYSALVLLQSSNSSGANLLLSKL